MLVRAEWRRLEELFSDLMAAGELDPAIALDAAERVFPGGEELAGFAQHPRADVRARAASTLGSSGHPRAEILLDALEKDDDPEVVEAAKGARATGRRFPPSRTITLFGGFSLRRGNWVVDERAWGRPTTARLVRVLLTQRGAFMPEEELLEALWPDKPPKSARSSIQVAVSRARSVLDVAGAEQSVIQYSERAYRLVLDDRDRVDTELFSATAGSSSPAAIRSEKSSSRRRHSARTSIGAASPASSSARRMSSPAPGTSPMRLRVHAQSVSERARW
jgi:hypothetical protein